MVSKPKEPIPGIEYGNHYRDTFDTCSISQALPISVSLPYEDVSGMFTTRHDSLELLVSVCGIVNVRPDHIAGHDTEIADAHLAITAAP